ncbi:MAG: transcriptional regulator BetI, partial [Pseudomonadota bacterium]
IEEVGSAGSLDVTVTQIARRAGVSSGLAHHYFGGKEQIFLAAMGHILTEFSAALRRDLARVTGPRARLEAVISASFHPENFSDTVVSAWLTFYVYAQSEPGAQRLWRVFARRLHSTMVYDLAQLTDRTAARRTAHVIAALIDGFYIRHALGGQGPSRLEIVALVADVLARQLDPRR